VNDNSTVMHNIYADHVNSSHLFIPHVARSGD